MERKNIFLKLIVSIALWATFYGVRNTFSPVFTNQQALKQMEDSAEAFTYYTAYQGILGYSWVIPLALCIFIFWNDIKRCFHRL